MYNNTIKKCPKCNGRLFLEHSFDGKYETCLNCGYLKYLNVNPDNQVRTRCNPRRK